MHNSFLLAYGPQWAPCAHWLLPLQTFSFAKHQHYTLNGRYFCLSTEKQQEIAKHLTVCVLGRFRHVWLLWPPWTVAHQTPLSMGFSRQDTGVSCHAFLQGIFPTQGLTPHPWCLLYWQVGSQRLASRFCYSFWWTVAWSILLLSLHNLNIPKDPSSVDLSTKALVPAKVQPIHSLSWRLIHNARLCLCGCGWSRWLAGHMIWADTFQVSS